MISVEYTELFSDLYDKTLKGEVNWKSTASENIFIVNLSNYSIKLSQFFNEGTDYVRFSILNEEGREVDEFTVNDDDSDWDSVYALYSNARRCALKINDAIKNIRETLSKSGTVGDNDVEIPF